MNDRFSLFAVPVCCAELSVDRTTGQWSATLFPTDPKSNVIKTHRLSADDTAGNLEEAELLFQTGVDYDTWVLDKMAPGSADDEGWLYALDSSHFDSSLFSTSNYARKRDYVRRRRWLRKRQITADAPVSLSTSPLAAEAKTSAFSPSPSAASPSPVPLSPLSPTSPKALPASPGSPLAVTPPDSGSGGGSAESKAKADAKADATSDQKLEPFTLINKTDRTVTVAVYRVPEEKVVKLVQVRCLILLLYICCQNSRQFQCQFAKFAQISPVLG